MNSTSGGKDIKPRRGSRGDELRLSPSYVQQLNTKAPQAVFKVISHARGSRVMAVLNYIERGDKPLEQQLEAVDQDGLKYTGKDEIRQVYEKWQPDFERATPPPRLSTKKEQRHDKPKVSATPPAHRRGRLRSLQQLTVVRDSERPELLLPGNVSSDLPDGREHIEVRGDGNRDRGSADGGRIALPVSHAKPEAHEPVLSVVDARIEKRRNEAKAPPDLMTAAAPAAAITDTKPERKPRHATHAILSADCENTPANAHKVMVAAQDVMREQIGDAGYRYMMVLHTDTPKPHVHVVINNYNTDTELPKLQLNPPDLFVIRSRFAERMTEMGLEQHATRRMDRPDVLERIQRGIEGLKRAGTWYEAKLFNASKAGAEFSGNDAPASPAMLKYARSLAEQKNVELASTKAADVRDFLVKHGKPRQDAPAFVVDAFEKRLAMTKAIAKIKEQVKETTLPFSVERRDRMKELRELGRTLIDPAAPNPAELVNRLAVKLRNDGKKMQKQLAELENPTPAKPKALSFTRQLERRRAMDKLIERRIEAVEKQRQAINTDPRISNTDRVNVMSLLKTHQTNMEKLSSTKGRER